MQQAPDHLGTGVLTFQFLEEESMPFIEIVLVQESRVCEVEAEAIERSGKEFVRTCHNLDEVLALCEHHARIEGAPEILAHIEPLRLGWCEVRGRQRLAKVSARYPGAIFWVRT